MSMWKCNMFYIKNRDVVYCTHVNSPEMEYCIRCGFNRCLDIPWALQLKVQDRIYQCNICRRHGVLNEHLICHHCSGPHGFKGYVWNCWKCDYNNPIVLRKCTECDTSREMTFVKREFMWKCDLCHYLNPFTSEDCYQCKHPIALAYLPLLNPPSMLIQPINQLTKLLPFLFIKTLQQPLLIIIRNWHHLIINR